tara:strand:- start:42 stop:254 length:213 start_codon:yes stop_codon:yes gene_type:complete
MGEWSESYKDDGTDRTKDTSGEAAVKIPCRQWWGSATVQYQCHGYFTLDSMGFALGPCSVCGEAPPYTKG